MRKAAQSSGGFGANERPVWSRRRQRGQALVEFALAVPIIFFILLGIYDMARVYTAQMAVESAAREAADFGAFNSERWMGDPTDTDSNYYKTVAGMTERACVATQTLEDYVGNASTCTNPDITIALTGTNGQAANNCDDASRPQGPCWVQVDLEYDFDVLVPLGIDFFGARLGLPDTLTFTQSSTFAISDFTVDE